MDETKAEIVGDSSQKSEHDAKWLLPGIVLIYFVVVLAQSAIKLLWGDELITFYIAQQPGWEGIWRALAAGADPNPPLIHVLVQASTKVFGIGAIAVRLPAILCVLLAIVSMWSFLRRWIAPRYAAAGVLTFMCTRGFDYSYDARSYAPLMGFAMAAFALWAALPGTRGWPRLVRLAGLAVCLGLGISSNYYGVLAFFPIAAGEVIRNRQQRRIGWAVWPALLVGALPLLAYLPLIRHNIAEFAPHAWNRPHLSMVGLSYIELVEGVFWPVLLLAGFAAWRRRARWPLPLAEASALAVLLLYPVIGFGIAIAGAGMISPRCVAPVCCGFGLALGLLASEVFGHSRRAQVALLSLFSVWFLAREGFCASQLYQQRQSFSEVRDQLRTQPESPVLVADSSLVLPLYFYSGERERAKIAFPIDFAAIHAFEKDDSGEQNLWSGRAGVFPFSIPAFASLPMPVRPFVVLARPDGWLASKLRERGVTLTTEEDRVHGQWYGLGGIFSPMVHPETRFLLGQPKPLE